MRVIIIGGVAAGMSAAAKANRILKDADVVVYEMGDTVSWGACGLPYFVGGFFDSPENMIARPVEKFREKEYKMLSEMVPLKRMGRVEEIADLIFFLVSDQSDYITGQDININGGNFMH